MITSDEMAGLAQVVGPAGVMLIVYLRSSKSENTSAILVLAEIRDLLKSAKLERKLHTAEIVAATRGEK